MIASTSWLHMITAEQHQDVLTIQRPQQKTCKTALVAAAAEVVSKYSEWVECYYSRLTKLLRELNHIHHHRGDTLPDSAAAAFRLQTD